MTKKSELCEKNIDTPYWEQHQIVCGIDEAGRGPLAGPVAVSAVILPAFCTIPGIDDSKKISPVLREKLAIEIMNKAIAYSVVMIGPDEIDEMNILRATLKGMQMSYAKLEIDADILLIDGRDYPFQEKSGMAVIKGDQKSMNIAAASILAKVSRDAYMIKQDKIYPAYGFARHKGYGTDLHRGKILELGASPIHRKSFLNKLQKKNPQITLF